MREAHELSVPTMSLHLAFAGNPGTGKTDFARLLGRIGAGLSVLESATLSRLTVASWFRDMLGGPPIKTIGVISKSREG